MNFGAIILVVEDNEADRLLIEDGLREGDQGTQIYLVTDGLQATQFLHRESRYTESPVPDLVILDLNLPKKSGQEVLLEMKQHAHLKCIPVVIFTSSEADTDIISAYENHANSYFSKPPDLDEFFAVLTQIKAYWLTNTKLPTRYAVNL